MLELPLEDRLELARRLVESAVGPAPLGDAVAESIRRIEALAAGHATGLTEGQFRVAKQESEVGDRRDALSHFKNSRWCSAAATIARRLATPRRTPRP